MCLSSHSLSLTRYLTLTLSQCSHDSLCFTQVVVPYIPPVVRKPAWKATSTTSTSTSTPPSRFGGGGGGGGEDDDAVDADLRSTVGNIISKLGNDKDVGAANRGRGMPAFNNRGRSSLFVDLSV